MNHRQRNSKGKFIKRLRPPNPRQLENVLHRLYYDIKNPVSFSSPLQLFNAAKTKISNLSQEDVNWWLSKQKTYTLHRSTKTVFPRRKVMVPAPMYQYQADLLFLVDLRKSNDGYKYLLTMIDVFSRRAVAVPLKTKTAEAGLQGLIQGFKDMGGPPLKLQTDQGTEFYNDVVTKYLRKNKIVHFSTFQKDIKAGMVERFNRTLRKLLSMYMLANKTERYIDKLADILKAYNLRKHAAFSHKYAPLDINAKNSKDVYNILYHDYLSLREKAFDFKIGDIVLRAYVKKDVGPSTKATQTYDPIRYVIVDRIASVPPVYKIKTLSTDTLQPGSFYAAQLFKIPPADENAPPP